MTKIKIGNVEVLLLRELKLSRKVREVRRVPEGDKIVKQVRMRIEHDNRIEPHRVIYQGPNLSCPAIRASRNRSTVRESQQSGRFLCCVAYEHLPANGQQSLWILSCEGCPAAKAAVLVRRVKKGEEIIKKRKTTFRLRGQSVAEFV